MTRVEAAAKALWEHASMWIDGETIARMLSAADAHAITEPDKIVRDLRAEAATMGDSRAGLMREAADAIEAGGREIERLREGLAKLVRRYDELGDERKLRVPVQILEPINEARAAIGRATGRTADD